MARKLPWTAQATRASTESQKKSTATATVTSGQKRKDREARPVTPESTPPAVRKRTSARSPSTSPIRSPTQPIAQISPMHSGLHADDRYIMVEDEFESVARQFTAHLHAAEYARLKRKAKEAPPRRLPNPLPSMSRTTSMNLEHKHLLSRQSTMMSEFGRQAGAIGAGSDLEDEGEGVEKLDDLWTGTSLAGLMDEGSQAKTSLMGVERLSGATRAAKGYGRGDTESTPKKKRKTIADIFEEVSREEAPDVVRHTTGQRERRRDLVEEMGADDKSKTRKELQEKASRPKIKKSLLDDDWDEELPPVTTKTDKHARFEITPSTSRAPGTGKPKRVFVDDFDDFEKTRSTIPASPSRTKPFTSSKSVQKPDKKKDRESRLDEVPSFFG